MVFYGRVKVKFGIMIKPPKGLNLGGGRGGRGREGGKGGRGVGRERDYVFCFILGLCGKSFLASVNFFTADKA